MAETMKMREQLRLSQLFEALSWHFVMHVHQFMLVYASLAPRDNLKILSDVFITAQG